MLKRKVAIGRFSNETRYGRTFLRTEDGDPLGKQASDMLTNRLIESGAFLVFERPDIDKIQKEQTFSGRGEATSEASDVMGFGSQADYDGTLNDKAIGTAVSDVMNSLVTKLTERPWRTDILKVSGQQVFISGGPRQGIKPGDTLTVMSPGETVKSGQTGFGIALPSTPVATLTVLSSFGTNETDEGSLCQVSSGTLPATTASLYVAEASK